ncbi:hypothetical protein FQN60_008967, partial [Etheostoma spectabile]
EVEFHEWLHVLLSHRGFCFQDIPHITLTLPGATLNGLAAESCFSPPAAVKRTRAHPMWRTGHQKEITSTAAFSGPCIHTVSAHCSF